ncbi:MAG: radical SAM protein [Candidatus Abyssobacteria bacterium SURF_5]|uniref:Radical SAM protein n=1 Tax=Abyssobacteria bacterium (strain SURF_5) TaxID=2093360 RepID=A0A3A4NY04_ABYX5|nr:MAG: radical SAM protein [Candidatus Abyssubacteria bacterium SURF_5]
MNYEVNSGYCNICDKVVPASYESRDGKMYLRKECARCGVTETLLSSDIERYQKKQEFGKGTFPPSEPRVVVVEVTNTCNLSCPTCMSNMGRESAKFDPPLEYFDRLFRSLSQRKPPPHIELFGGEPTTRDDLPAIIALGFQYGLHVCVCTNGVRLADEEYCRQLLSTGAGIHFQFDGMDSCTYRLLRGNEDLLEKKLTALGNTSKYVQTPISIFCTLARGINDKALTDIIEFCRQRRKVVGALYLIPLARTWDNGEVQFAWREEERLTVEDVENLVAEKFSGIEFLPAGSMDVPVPFRELLRPFAAFRGASPSCESIAFLISTENGYVPASEFLKTSFYELAEDLKKKASRNNSDDPKKKDDESARTFWGKILISLWYGSLIRKHVKLDRVFSEKGLKKYLGMLRLVLNIRSREKRRRIFEEITGKKSIFRLVVLPYQDRFQHQSQCVERCPVAVGFLDPENDSVRTIPLCSWRRHRSEILSKMSRPGA